MTNEELKISESEKAKAAGFKTAEDQKDVDKTKQEQKPKEARQDKNYAKETPAPMAK